MIRKLFMPLLLVISLTIIFNASVSVVSAKDREYDAVVKQLQKTYQAKKVKIPFMWLARLAVRVVKPAGVKSFSFTAFENVRFNSETLDSEIHQIMTNSLSADWLPVVRIRSKSGDQIYAYMKEDKNDVRMMLVTISEKDAVVAKARFSPEKLLEFLDEPKIFGVQLN